MNPAFDEVLAAGSDAILSAFDTTALRLGTTSQNIEKDFWVCWTLDALFHGLKEGGPRLLFKGGTSLSKGFGLIDRFSEDIDVTVFRDDIGEPASIEELDALSGKKRRARLDAIKDACQAYINGSLRAELTLLLQDRLQAAGLDAGVARVEADDADPDGQTLLIWYPAATPRSDYVRAAIKIESGAKSALDPNSEVPIKPYVDAEIEAERNRRLGDRLGAIRQEEAQHRQGQIAEFRAIAMVAEPLTGKRRVGAILQVALRHRGIRRDHRLDHHANRLVKKRRGQDS